MNLVLSYEFNLPKSLRSLAGGDGAAPGGELPLLRFNPDGRPSFLTFKVWILDPLELISRTDRAGRFKAARTASIRSPMPSPRSHDRASRH